MHVAIAWDHKPLLLLATALLPNRTTESFEREAGPPYDKQRIQMAPLQMSPSSICSGRTVACQAPPPAIVEVLQDYVTNYHKIRRLHLVVVDLFFFSPALPDKCETWSVNNWN